MNEVLLNNARHLLLSNTVEKNVFLNGEKSKIIYTAPSPGTYDQQWFWDSCLHSLVWMKLGEKDRAFQELESLMIGKGKKEFFPHMIFWKLKKDIYWRLFDKLYLTERYSEIIQPPIIGYSLKCLKNAGIRKKELGPISEEVLTYYTYILKERDPEDMGLISIVHPWESGLDSSPSFDLDLEKKKFLKFHQWKRMRSLLKEFHVLNWNQRRMAQESSFRVKCILTNTLLAWGMEAFANLLEEMNRTDEAYELREKIDRIWHSFLRYCWNEKDGLFYNLEMKKGGFDQIRTNTISSLLPLLLDIPADIKDRLVEHIIDKTEYWARYPIPTVAMTEKSFNPSNNSLLWRGPTWINTNFFIWLGLKKHKEAKLANELAKRTTDLVQKSGFREFYNPLSGDGGGTKNFGWSTLVLLMEEHTEILFR